MVRRDPAKINLNGFGIGNLFAAAVADGARFMGDHLTQVALRDNRLDPAGTATLLAKLPRKSLMYLDLANNKLGRKGITALCHALPVRQFYAKVSQRFGTLTTLVPAELQGAEALERGGNWSVG